MATERIVLEWKRPQYLEYPKVWHTFKARDLNSNELVEYRIQDLPESRVEDILDHMCQNYIADEPVSQILGGYNDPVCHEDFKMIWRSMIEQKVPIVCFKAGCDDIVGVNMLFVETKNDHFFQRYYKQFQSAITREMIGIDFLLYTNFEPFEHYGVDKFLASSGLSVSREYRGRGIGDQLLTTRKLLCKEYELKFTQAVFTSDFSNRNADKAGFVTNVALSYDEILKSHPHLKIRNIKSHKTTLKTLFC